MHLQFMKVFSSFKDIKVIKFSSVQDAFQGFTDKARKFFFFHMKFYFFELTQSNKTDIMHWFSRIGKINSEIVLSGMWAYGAVCQIKALATYIMICTGMRNQDGKQFLLKLPRMIIPLGKINIYLCLSWHWNGWGK